ncbi:MAG: hypothetical protein KHY28_07665 [Firmicutes bacterium]|uniref:hypothetical protein n=1 Tax=Vescimonas coprocola TaxID=2714355 RepID=UPI001BCB2F87|nr:hypothetical protein [Vescimonas coprocola]MBS5504100.1 hypothetical protein [Bacillota bacterium]
MFPEQKFCVLGCLQGRFSGTKSVCETKCLIVQGAVFQESQTISHHTEKGVACAPTKRGFDFRKRLSGLFADSPFSRHTAQTAENEKTASQPRVFLVSACRFS